MLTRRTALFAVLLLWCGALLAVRVLRAHNVSYVFLVWNLFLAVIPAQVGLLSKC